MIFRAVFLQAHLCLLVTYKNLYCFSTIYHMKNLQRFPFYFLKVKRFFIGYLQHFKIKILLKFISFFYCSTLTIVFFASTSYIVHPYQSYDVDDNGFVQDFFAFCYNNNNNNNNNNKKKNIVLYNFVKFKDLLCYTVQECIHN